MTLREQVIHDVATIPDAQLFVVAQVPEALRAPSRTAEDDGDRVLAEAGMDEHAKGLELEDWG